MVVGTCIPAVYFACIYINYPFQACVLEMLYISRALQTIDFDRILIDIPKLKLFACYFACLLSRSKVSVIIKNTYNFAR